MLEDFNDTLIVRESESFLRPAGKELGRFTPLDRRAYAALLVDTPLRGFVVEFGKDEVVPSAMEQSELLLVAWL